MRIIIPLLSFFLILSCKPKKTNNTPKTPIPTVKEEIGIFKNATIYTGRSDYEFEVNGQSILVRISNIDTLNQPDIPTNLIDPNADGLPGPNPILIGAKYKLAFGPQGSIKSIRLAGAHDPSNTEIPAIPENYSGLLSVGPSADSRAFLNISADLSAILFDTVRKKRSPSGQIRTMDSFGRWHARKHPIGGRNMGIFGKRKRPCFGVQSNGNRRIKPPCNR